METTVNEPAAVILACSMVVGIFLAVAYGNRETLRANKLRYKLRTLLFVLALGPLCLYVVWLLLQLAFAINAIVEPYPRQY
jgi:hypothetical protein